MDGAYADDVAEAGGSEQCGMAHATKEGSVRKLGPLVGELDGRLADANGDDIAHNHHQGHFGRPSERSGSDGQKRGEHANPEETPHLQVLDDLNTVLVKVIHPGQTHFADVNAGRVQQRSRRC